MESHLKRTRRVVIVLVVMNLSMMYTCWRVLRYMESMAIHCAAPAAQVEELKKVDKGEIP